MQPYLSAFVSQRSCRNYSIEELNNIFNGIVIPLQNFELVCIGFDVNNKKISRCFRIISAGGVLFLGNHQVEIDLETRNVHSLRFLKRGIFGMVDMVSFERSTFLFEPKSEKFIRLKNIRQLLTIPTTGVSNKRGIHKEVPIYKILERHLDPITLHMKGCIPDGPLSSLLEVSKYHINQYLNSLIEKANKEEEIQDMEKNFLFYLNSLDCN